TPPKLSTTIYTPFNTPPRLSPMHIPPHLTTLLRSLILATLILATTAACGDEPQQNPPTQHPIDCAPGTSKTADDTCTTCPSGTFSTSPNTESCTPHTQCAPDEFIEIPGTTTTDNTCTTCPSGTFSD